MSKLFSFVITIFLLVPALLVIIPVTVEGDAMQSPTRQPIHFYMYGPGDNGNLSFKPPTTNEDEEEECPSDGNMFNSESDVGTWVSEPFARRCNLTGSLNISLWAKGDVRDVRFMFDISVNGNGGGNYESETMDTESTPKLFSVDANINLGGIQAGDRIHIDIAFDGGETDIFTADERQAYIVYGSIDHPSGITGPIDTVFFDYSKSDVQINDENAEEDKDTIVCTATIFDAIGSDDLVDLDFKAQTIDFTGSNYDFDILQTTDESIRIEWKWRYGDDHAPSGGYELNVSASDKNGNHWWKTQDITVVTNRRPKVDFVLNDIDLTTDPSPTYAGKHAFITATVHAYGDGDLVGLIPRVDFMVSTPTGASEVFHRSISINANSDAIVQVDYLFNMTGIFTITVEINPKAGQSYEEYNDLGDAEDNNIGVLTLTIGNEPKGDSDGEWYEPDEIKQTLEDEPLYGAGIVAAIVVIVVVSLIMVRRRRQMYEDFDDDEYDDEDF